MKEEIEYEKLRLDVIQKMIDERGIVCKNKKDDMIKHLKLDDEDKYIRETTPERNAGGYIIGIDHRNKNHLSEIAKLIDKKEARKLSRYCDNRLQYWCSQKLI
jgi:hypothetical protein